MAIVFQHTGKPIKSGAGMLLRGTGLEATSLLQEQSARMVAAVRVSRQLRRRISLFHWKKLKKIKQAFKFK